MKPRALIICLLLPLFSALSCVYFNNVPVGIQPEASVAASVVNSATLGYAVGGTVTGLAGTGLVLSNNGGETLNISANGSFIFPTAVNDESPYAVTVVTQPSGPTQTCTVSGGSGTISGSHITSINVFCTTNSYSVGGTVTGLLGTGLVIQNNGGDNIAVSANGAFTFSTVLLSGATFNVSILTQPSGPTQTCTVSGGSAVVGGANVSSVVVNCSTNTYTIGGTISGLAGGGLVLRNNGGDNLAVSANGAFAFATPLSSGATYAVTVLTQPSGPTQTCSVTSGSGTVVAANITSVSISCTTNTYTVGGTVSGLSGGGLVLQNNGGDNLAVSSNGAFTFATSIASGSGYNVTVLTQPSGPTQTCNVSGGSGTVTAGNITSITVNCSTNTYTVGGTVSGLAGSGLVLRNNGGDDLAISSNGAFAFSTPIASGAGYNVTVFTQPSSLSQTCTVTSGSGTVGGANITSVSISCSTNSYTVGGTVSGLAGSGLILQNNGGDNLAVSSNGAFTFASSVLSGGSYNVTVFTQPSGPTQTCSVTSGSGAVTSANITSVNISCVTNTYTIGGTVTGLAGSGLVLRNNGGDDLAVSSNGAFTFSTSIASGAGYNVTVFTQPSGPTQTCNVSGGSGTVAAGNITSVTVNCSTNSYTIGGNVSGLAGGGLVLQNNGGDNLAISANGSFSFATSVLSGAGYNVTVLTQPSSPNQTCTVTSGSGTVSNANITSVSISCVTIQYTVNVTVGQMTGTGMVVQNNGGDNRTINADGSFSFTAQDDGTTYSVTILTQPSGPVQNCSVFAGSGTLAGANVTNVTISCVDPSGDVPGLGFWYRADAITGLTNGQNVTSWTDSSSAGWPAIQAGGVNPPTYRTGVLHGLPVVRFNGNQHLSLETNCPDSTSNGITIFSVVASRIGGSGPKFVYDYGAYSGGGYGLSLTTGDGQGWTGGVFANFSPGLSSGTFALFTYRIEFAVEQRVFMNGSSIGLDTGTTMTNTQDKTCGDGLWGGGGAGPFTLGGQAKTFNAGSRRFDGDMAELLWYGFALGTTDREKVECMLKTKYNLTSVSNPTCP